MARKVIDRQRPHARRKVRKGKAATAEQQRFHERVREMPCLACGAWPVSVHHVRHDGFKGITRNHWLVVPLCPACHQHGPNAVHTIGYPAFDALHGISQYQHALHLKEDFNA